MRECLADVAVKVSGPGGKSRDLTVTATTPGAAAMTIHTTEGVAVVDVTVGRAASFEILLVPTAVLDENAASELEMLTNAVLSGHVREELWFAGDKLVKSKGIIGVGKAEVSTRRYGLASLFTRAALRRESYTYAAYNVR